MREWRAKNDDCWGMCMHGGDGRAGGEKHESVRKEIVGARRRSQAKGVTGSGDIN